MFRLYSCNLRTSHFNSVSVYQQWPSTIHIFLKWPATWILTMKNLFRIFFDNVYFILIKIIIEHHILSDCQLSNIKETFLSNKGYIKIKQDI